MQTVTATTPNQHKLIFKGRLEFGSQRTYDMVVKHWHSRIETYFKTDILFKAEQVFVDEDFAFTVPQQTLMSTEKNWRNTTALLYEVAQFALAGQIGAWWVQKGEVLDARTIEPTSEKAVVTEYLRGCELIGQAGMESEATAALSRAIEKFERHALAYERRGYINYKLKNFNDALYDFSKSIDINPNNSEPFYGRGKVKMLKNEWESAAMDFDCAIRRSIPVQTIHWLARFRRGESLFHAKQFSEAARELGFFLQRKFKENDPNMQYRAKAEHFVAECAKQTSDRK
jgi:tetratricopeptide (TPR) repeat protein